MQIRMTGPAIAVADRAGTGGRAARLALVLMTVVAGAAGLAVLVRRGGTPLDPDLVRVLRFMALMKGGFAIAAFAACFWRLARPARPWRVAVYVAGPPLMTAGAAALWALHDLGPAALALHLGLFATLAAALTDPDFLSALPRARPGSAKRPV